MSANEHILNRTRVLETTLYTMLEDAENTAKKKYVGPQHDERHPSKPDFETLEVQILTSYMWHQQPAI